MNLVSYLSRCTLMCVLTITPLYAPPTPVQPAKRPQPVAVKPRAAQAKPAAVLAKQAQPAPVKAGQVAVKQQPQVAQKKSQPAPKQQLAQKSAPAQKTPVAQAQPVAQQWLMWGATLQAAQTHFNAHVHLAAQTVTALTGDLQSSINPQDTLVGLNLATRTYSMFPIGAPGSYAELKVDMKQLIGALGGLNTVLKSQQKKLVPEVAAAGNKLYAQLYKVALAGQGNQPAAAAQPAKKPASAPQKKK